MKTLTIFFLILFCAIAADYYLYPTDYTEMIFDSKIEGNARCFSMMDKRYTREYGTPCDFGTGKITIN